MVKRSGRGGRWLPESATGQCRRETEKGFKGERDVLEVEEDKVKEREEVGPRCKKNNTCLMILIGSLELRHSC
jgi:hypothetical protein